MPRPADVRSRWPEILTGFFVLLFATGLPWPLLMQLTGMLLALGVFALAVRRPDLAACGLIVFLPVQVYGLAWLYSHGVPGALVRSAAGTKELLMGAIFVAGVLAIVRDPAPRLDVLDKLALGIVALVVTYFVLAPLITPSAPGGFATHLVGLRANLGYVLVFFGARHAAWPERTDQRLLRAAFLAMGIAGASVVWHGIDPSGFNRFTFETVDYLRYQIEVQGSNDATVHQLVAGFRDTRRFGILDGALVASSVLVVGLAVSIPGVLARRAAPANLALAGICVAGILYTGTRVALVAAAAVVVGAVVSRTSLPPARRFNLAAAAILGALVLVPFAAGTRFAGDAGAGVSNSGHIEEITRGLRLIAANPLGTGLGVGGGTVKRFADGGADFIAGRSLLAVGVQMGVIAMLLFGAFWVAVLARALRRTRSGSGDLVLLAGTLGLIGLLVASFTQSSMTTLPAVVLVFVFLGRGLRARTAPVRHAALLR